MTPLEYYCNGTIKDLFNKGLIGIKVYIYFQIYESYSNHLINNSHYESIHLTAIDFNVCRRTVKRALHIVLDKTMSK